ncbi:MAG: DoxX family protein [Bacteroidales bacterium]
MKRFFKYLFMHSCGHTYRNLSRLFIRLFVGVMFLQFGIKQIVNYNMLVNDFPAVLGMDSATTLIVMISIEICCSIMIMFGILTRIATIPPIVSMIIAEILIMTGKMTTLPNDIVVYQPAYLPVMFIGIFCFIILSGPGKISFDYLISLHFLNYDEEKGDEEVLDTV